jgi:hypothetical protein
MGGGELMALVTLDDAKKQLNITASDTSGDVELQGFVDAATAAVETQLGQVVDRRTVTEEIAAAGRVTSFLLSSVPVISLTSLVSLDGTQTWSVDPSVAHVDSASGRVTLLSGPPFIGPGIAIYQAGMTAVRANIRLAALIIIQHLWETQRGTMGVQLGGDSDNYVAGRGFAVPRRAIELLGTPLPGVA